MWVTATTVPILPELRLTKSALMHVLPQSRRRGSSGTVVATRLSTSGLSPERLLSLHAPQARLTTFA